MRVTRFGLITCAFLVLCGIALSQGAHSDSTLPGGFVIGRRTFFDFGPPFNFYELLLVGPAGNGSSIERITLTPAGDACTMPAKVETASATIDESVATLFGTTNPCTIPEKELKRELKRCKNCLVFSGADVAMQVQCGSHTRIIRSDILDRDMFDAHANTPKRTSWTMQLLARLDQAIGPGVMDRPMISMPGQDEASTQNPDSAALRDTASGKYDILFQRTPDKPSDLYLYRAAQKAPLPLPTVSLLSSVPFQPTVSVLPPYPPIARAARIEGDVTFTADIDSTGKPTHIALESGNPFLRPAVENAVAGWRFPQESFKVRVTIDFALNCHTSSSSNQTPSH